MTQELQLFLMALSQLTRLPVPGWALPRPEWLPHSARHWPAVGLLVGAAGSATLWLAGHLWTGPVSVLVASAAMVWLTRASGEAGFAAVFPTPAGVGVWLLLALRVAALQGLAARDLEGALAALPLAHAVSHGAAVLAWHRLPGPAAERGGRAEGLSLAMAAVWCALAAAVAAPFLPAPAWLAALAAPVALTLGLEGTLRRRCGRFGRDAGSAVQTLAEAVSLLAVLAVLAQG